jgi:phytoene desaturase
VAFFEKTWCVHGVIGGCAALAEGMAGLVRGQGGRVRLGVEVDRILVENGRADIVVSGADAGHTYMRLLRERPKKRWTDARLKLMRWSMSLFVWHFGAKGTRGMWSDIGRHTIFSGPRHGELVRDIFRRGHLADDMSVYLHRPTVIDPTAAPEGGMRSTPSRRRRIRALAMASTGARRPSPAASWSKPSWKSTSPASPTGSRRAMR